MNQEKILFIAEKPSVAQEFAKILGDNLTRRDGYIESENMIFTWCVGHLVAMSYPEVYDEALKKWRLDKLPFIPEKYKYEVIKSVKKQFNIISKLLFRTDISKIYVCTDSGREGEYIYRLIEEILGKPKAKRYRVWIDSQTEDEIKRGVNEAKSLENYDKLSDSAYLRAKEDYLMGINFSRLLTLKYGNKLAEVLNKNYVVIAIGRVMTCVLGMVVNRENEIRNFVKTKFYKPVIKLYEEGEEFTAEWRLAKKSVCDKTKLYKNNGFLDKEYAQKFVDEIGNKAVVKKIEAKKELKNPPYLYNLAELQNECSKSFKISPDKTLEIAQELYEKKMITYPRTDAKFLSSSVAKELDKNLKGLENFPKYGIYVKEILQTKSYKKIEKSRYTNDSKITDHYAIIPTGVGINNFYNLTTLAQQVYGKILLRFLSIMFPPAKYLNNKITLNVDDEEFTLGSKNLVEEGYLKIVGVPKKESSALIPVLTKGQILDILAKEIVEGETTPPKRYTTGSIILAMENAGSLIEDEELRAVIKSSGIGTSATRADIIKKLDNNGYISVNKKTQVITTSILGESIYKVVSMTIPGLLNPKLSASWEKGLTMVANGEIHKDEYMFKLKNFVKNKVELVKSMPLNYNIKDDITSIKRFY